MRSTAGGWRPPKPCRKKNDTSPAWRAGAVARSARSACADGLSRTMADGKTLNDGQWEAATGLLDSCNRVNLVEGPAGAGKSHRCSANTMKA